MEKIGTSPAFDVQPFTREVVLRCSPSPLVPWLSKGRKVSGYGVVPVPVLSKTAPRGNRRHHALAGGVVSVVGLLNAKNAAVINVGPLARTGEVPSVGWLGDVSHFVRIPITCIVTTAREPPEISRTG